MNKNRRASLSRHALLGGLTTLPVFLPRAMAQDAPTPSQKFSRPPARPASADQVLASITLEHVLRARKG